MDLYKSEKTKYDVPLNHLDYGYIEKCQNSKELEKIIKVLRGGYEGHYPELQKLAEDKLESINPDSRILVKDKPVSSKKDLGVEERDNMETDIQNWINEMKQHVDVPATDGTEGDTLPPVRSVATNIPIDQKSAEEAERAKRRVLPRSHKEWDKIDIEAELAKVDNADARPTVKKLSNNDASLQESVKTTDLNEPERMNKANKEKDKGNEAFRCGDYEEALAYYNRSLSVIPMPATYNNRAQTYLKMQKWKEAYKDCNTVLDVEPENVKALLRRAVSSQGLKDYSQAKNDLLTVLHVDPSNKKAKQVMEEIEHTLAEQKVKGRRMVIEEIDGSDDEEEEDSSRNKMNGHVEIEMEKSPVENKKKPLVEKNKTSEEKSGKAPAQKKKKSQKVKNNSEKDIWTEEDLNPKAQSYTANIKIDKSESNSKIKSSNVKSEKVKSEKKAKDKIHSVVSETVDQKSNTVNVKTEKEDAKINDPPEIENDNRQIEDKSENESQTKIEIHAESDSNKTQSELAPAPPEPVKPVQAVLPPDVAALKDQGNQKFKTGQYSEATQVYDKCIGKLIKVGSSQNDNLSILYCNRAASRHKTGDCRGCVCDCNSALQLQPANVKALARRAMAYEAMEKYRDAYVDYRQILLMDSTVDIAQQGSSRCSSHLNTLDGVRWRDKLPTITPIIAPSINLLQNLTPQTPNSQTPLDAPVVKKEPEPKVDKGKMFEKYKVEGNEHVKKGSYQSAIDSYSKCIEYCPSNVAAYTNRALCFLKTNQPMKVIDDCTIALMVEVDNVKALYRRALAHKDLKQYGRSVEDFKHLLKIDPKNNAAKKEFAVTLREKQLSEQKQKSATSKPAPKMKKQQHATSQPPKGRHKIQIEEIESSDSSDEDEAVVLTSGSDNTNSTSEVDCDQTKPKSASKPDSNSKLGYGSNSQKSTNIEFLPKVDINSETSDTPQSKETVTENVTKSDKKAKKTNHKAKNATKDTQPVTQTVPTLSKASPYEFMQAWGGLKSAEDISLHAALLDQVKPADLKTVISNKLEADMMMTIVRCSSHIADRGDVSKAFQYLVHLPKVPRFSMIAMFMSAEDKQEVSSVVEKLQSRLGAECSTHDLSYVHKQFSL